MADNKEVADNTFTRFLGGIRNQIANSQSQSNEENVALWTGVEARLLEIRDKFSLVQLRYAKNPVVLAAVVSMWLNFVWQLAQILGSVAEMADQDTADPAAELQNRDRVIAMNEIDRALDQLLSYQ